MDTIESFLDQLTTISQKLYGLPAAALVVLACIVLGYMLRFIKAFPNDGIPLAVILFGAVLYPIIAEDKPDMTLRIWLVRNVLIGLVLGFAAWLLHKQVLARIEDKLFADPNAKP